MRRLLTLFLFLSILAAACGDDSSGGLGDFGDSSDDAGGAGAGGDFCDFVGDASDRFDLADFSNPETFEATYRDVLDDYESAARFAPDAIKADVALVLDFAGDFMEAMDEIDWDFAAMPLDDPRIVNPEADAASDRLDEFCGLDDDDFDTDVPDPEDFVDPDLLDDLSNIEPGDAEAFLLQTFMIIGHDEDTARCLVEEFGPDFDPDAAGADLLTQEFCGMTYLEVFSGGG